MEEIYRCQICGTETIGYERGKICPVCKFSRFLIIREPEYLEMIRENRPFVYEFFDRKQMKKISKEEFEYYHSLTLDEKVQYMMKSNPDLDKGAAEFLVRFSSVFCKRYIPDNPRPDNPNTADKSINTVIKFCENCGNQISANAKFCGQCGAAINNSDVQRVAQNNTYSPMIKQISGADRIVASSRWQIPKEYNKYSSELSASLDRCNARLVSIRMENERHIALGVYFAEIYFVVEGDYNNPEFKKVYDNYLANAK